MEQIEQGLNDQRRDIRNAWMERAKVEQERALNNEQITEVEVSL